MCVLSKTTPLFLIWLVPTATRIYLETDKWRDSPRLGIFTSVSSVAMIEKTLRHQTTSEHLLFSSWFIIRVFPQWAVRALLIPIRMQGRQKLSLRLCCTSAPRDIQRRDLNPVNILDICYRYGCTLKHSVTVRLCACKWIHGGMNGRNKDSYTSENYPESLQTLIKRYSEGPWSILELFILQWNPFIYS